MEATLLEAFKHNPLPFVLALAAGGIGLLLCIVGFVLVRKAPKAAIVVGLFGALAGFGAVGMGLFGWWSGRTMVDAVVSVPGLTANDRARLQELGYAEASYSLLVGAVSGVLPALGGLIVAGVGVARSRRN